MSIVEEDEDVILKGGPLHDYLINSGYNDFEVYDKNLTNESVNIFSPSKPNSFLKNYFHGVLCTKAVQKYVPALYEDMQCYDKFLSTLLNSSIVRAEAEYWLRNLRLASKATPVDILGVDESLLLWQSPLSFLVEKTLLVFFLAQGGVIAYKKILQQQRLITLQRMLAALEIFNRKLGMALHLTQQGEMSQRFLSSTFNDLADSFLLKSSPNGTARLIELLKNVSWLIKSSLEKMQLVNPLPAEFNCTQALHSMLVPAAFLKESDLCLKDLKESHHYYKEVLTVFTHQLAMNFIAQTKQEGKVDAIFPVLHELALAAMESNVQLKQTIDVLRGVNLLKAPPRIEQLRNSELKKHSFYVNPLIPAIESSGLHLRNALSFIVNSDDDNDLGNVVQILQASRMEVAAADSFLHKAEILVNRLNKTKEASAAKEKKPDTDVNCAAPIPLDFSTNLSEIGDPFLEEIYQGTSFTHSLEWDNGEEGAHPDDSTDSASSAYYRHLMNELHSVLVTKGKSRISPAKTPSLSENSAPNVVTSTPYVRPSTAPREPSSMDLNMSNNNDTSAETLHPTPKPRSKYASERIEQMTYVSPATMMDSSPLPMKTLANVIAQRAQQLGCVEETFEDETVFEDAEDITVS